MIKNKTYTAEHTRYYDLLYKDKNYTAEADYVSQYMERYGQSGISSILELGCGTGLHAALLAGKKYVVHGIDRSKDMIEGAQLRKNDLLRDISTRLSFEQSDLRFYRNGLKYDAVVSLFHVMSFQTSNEDLFAAFQTAKAHLKYHGLFIFDCWYGPAVLKDPPVVRVKRMEDDDVIVMRIAEPTVHPNENCVDVNYTVWIRDKQTAKVQEVREIHKMRYLFKPEIEHMSSLSGLSLIAAQEWLSGNQLDSNTWYGCFIAENR